MKERIQVTQALLRELYNYDRETGEFTFKVRRGRMLPGARAGKIDNHGYRILSICKYFYKASRLAWLYEYGAFPENAIDHINQIRSDDRIANLRDVSNQMNSFNLGVARKNNKSGHVGVHLNARSKRYYANIQCRGKNIFLGVFLDIKDAAAAYTEAKTKYHRI